MEFSDGFMFSLLHLDNVEYPFIAITQRFTLRVVETFRALFIDQYICLKLLVFDRNT